MAIYQPTTITPSTFAGTGGGVIAAADNVNISWQINGSSPMRQFRIQVYENTSAAALVHDTEVIEITPFYGTDANGNPVLYSYQPNVTWGSWGIQDGKEYKMQITQSWLSLDVTAVIKNVVQFSPSVFISRSAPTLSITTFSDPITTISNTFTAQYSQLQGDTVNWVRWVLENATTGEILSDTGIIHTSVLSFSYDGFLTGNDYVVSCTIETENGVQISASNAFAVEYVAGEASGNVSLACNQDGSLQVNWANPSSIPGTPSPSADYGTFENGGFTLAAGASVVWDTVNSEPMNFEQPFSIFLRANLNSVPAASTDITVLDINNSELEIIISDTGATDNYFDIRNNGVSVLDSPFALPKTATGFLFTLNATQAQLVVFSSGGSSAQSRVTNYLSSLASISRIEMSRAADNTIWLTYFGISIMGIDDLTTATATLTWTDQTLFLANFENTLEAGLLGIDGLQSAVYRQQGNKLLPIAKFAVNDEGFADYGLQSGLTYDYRVYYIGDNNTYYSAILSPEMCVRYRAYSLIEATQDDTNPNIYNVLNVWNFGANIEAGGISNNNTPNFLMNFTKYPLRQPSAPNYKSGVLQALLSNVQDGNYSDTASQMESLFAISNSLNTFFLKDLKGNLYMVHTAGPITQTINNKSAKQEVTVSIPWQEVGSAEGIALIKRQD